MITVDLTPDQLVYLRKLIVFDLHENQRIVRSHGFAKYGRDEMQRFHDDVRTAGVLLGRMPQAPKPVPPAEIPQRFLDLGETA